jgi:hypothetical protein
MKVQRRSKAIVISLCSMIATLVAGAPAISQAKWIRRPATSCRQSYNDKDLIHITSQAELSGNILNSDTQRAGIDSTNELYCDLEDSDYFPRRSITHVNVHINDGAVDGQSRAQICAADHDSLSAGCSAFAYTGTQPAEVTLQPDVTILQNYPSGHFATLHVKMDSLRTYGGQRFRGYYVDDL